MRLYEIMLTISCTVLLLSAIFGRIFHRMIGVIASIVSMSMLTLHLWQEGYRWQMLGIYAPTVVLAIIQCWKGIASVDSFRLWKPVRFSLYVLSSLMIAISVLLASYLPVFQLPKPSGAYQVGAFSRLLTDKERDEVYTEDSEDKRKLLVQVWYPAQVEEEDEQAGNVIQMKGAKHYNFTDLQLYSNLLQFVGATGPIDGQRGTMIVNKYVLDFFNKQLKGTGGHLLKGANNEFPEATFH